MANQKMIKSAQVLLACPLCRFTAFDCSPTVTIEFTVLFNKSKSSIIMVRTEIELSLILSDC